MKNLRNAFARSSIASCLAIALVTSIAITAAPAAEAVEYDGSELYALNCANCHGTYGEGDGAMTPDLSVVLLDLRYLAARNQGAFPEEFVLQIVDGREVRAAHGPSGMPVWGAEFARGEGTSEAAEARVAQKIQAIVDFIASIQIVE
jgi:mono/diheme cytochrome c family protein